MFAHTVQHVTKRILSGDPSSPSSSAGKTLIHSDPDCDMDFPTATTAFLPIHRAGTEGEEDSETDDLIMTQDDSDQEMEIDLDEEVEIEEEVEVEVEEERKPLLTKQEKQIDNFHHPRSSTTTPPPSRKRRTPSKSPTKSPSQTKSKQITAQVRARIEKPYQCRVDPSCTKVFRDASTRTRHEKVHSSSKFPCNVCGVEYSRKDNRNRHEAKCTTTTTRPSFAKATKNTTKRTKVFRKTAHSTRTVPIAPVSSRASGASIACSPLRQQQLNEVVSRKRAFMINGVLHKLGIKARSFGDELRLTHPSRQSSGSNVTSPSTLLISPVF